MTFSFCVGSDNYVHGLQHNLGAGGDAVVSYNTKGAGLLLRCYYFETDITHTHTTPFILTRLILTRPVLLQKHLLVLIPISG